MVVHRSWSRGKEKGAEGLAGEKKEILERRSPGPGFCIIDVPHFSGFCLAPARPPETESEIYRGQWLMGGESQLARG